MLGNMFFVSKHLHLENFSLLRCDTRNFETKVGTKAAQLAVSGIPKLADGDGAVGIKKFRSVQFGKNGTANTTPQNGGLFFFL